MGKRVLSPRRCEQCGGPIVTDHVSRTRFCSKVCSTTHTARHRSNYRGWVRNPKGYILERAPKHPMASREGYLMQHRRIAAETLGRMLLPTEVVDHINGVKWDNRPENLRVMDKRAHDSLPKPPKKPINCPHCGGLIILSGRTQRVTAG
jgi:hypothetical protein